MATARKQQSQEVEEEEEEAGLGTAGKFTVERYLRKSPAKPYDRPPSGKSSWILKLVDPAQRLVSSGSQILSSSALRRLTSRVLSESSQSRKDDKKADGTIPFEFQVEETNVVENRDKSEQFGMMELETTLKQKTFTRSEIDHLTALLHSRTVDLPVEIEEKKFEFISSIPKSIRKEFDKVPNSEVKMGRQAISTPILSSSVQVLDEDISSPAEIARAYMHNRQRKVSPSIQSSQATRLGENSAGPSSQSFSSKSTDSLLSPSTTSQGLKRRSSFSYSHIGSILPPRRIRQKRSIHLSKGLSLPISPRPISVPVDGFSFDASQSSKFAKVGHFQSSIRNLQLPLKPKISFPRKSIMNVESDNILGAGSSSIYTPSYHVMASKILEQLTPPKKKVSTLSRLPVGEKSPLKLSPFTIGEHLRNVKDVDLPSEEFIHDDKQSNSLHMIPYHENQDDTFQNKEKPENLKPLDPDHRSALLDSVSIGCSKDSMNNLGDHLRNVKDVDLPSEEFVHDEKQSDSLHMIPYHDNQDDTFQNKEKPKNMKPLDPDHRCALLKDSGSIGCSKDSMNNLEVPASTVVKSIIQPPVNKPAFQMVPDKDIVNHDESSADTVAPATVEVKYGDNSLAPRQTTANEALAPANSQTTSEVIVDSPLNRSSDSKTCDERIDDDMVTRLTSQNASSLATTSQLETIDSAPTNSFGSKDLPENKRNNSPDFSFVNNNSPGKQPYSSSTTFDDGNKDASLTESRSAPINGNGAPYPYTQSNPASSYSDVQESVHLNGDISSNHKLDRSWGICNDAFSSSASISAGLAFSFRSSACTQSSINGPSISCPSLFSSNDSSIAFTSQRSSRNIFLSATTNNHPSTTNLTPSFAPSTTGLVTYEEQIKQDASLNKENDTYFNSITTPENSNNGTSSFGATATPSSMNDQLSTPTISNATELGAREVSSGKGFIVNAERTSMVLESFMFDASSGMAGKSSVSSGISFGCSSSASELFNLGSMPSEFPNNGLTSDPATSTIGTSYDSTSSACLGFEPSAAASFSSICPTTSAAAASAGSSSKPVSSNSHPKVAHRVSSGKNQCEAQGISKDNAPLFSQKPIPPLTSGSSFGPAASVLNPLQVAKQQTYSSRQAKARGSFTSSVGDGDKARRRFVKVRRKKQQKHLRQG